MRRVSAMVLHGNWSRPTRPLSCPSLVFFKGRRDCPAPGDGVGDPIWPMNQSTEPSACRVAKERGRAGPARSSARALSNPRYGLVRLVDDLRPEPCFDRLAARVRRLVHAGQAAVFLPVGHHWRSGRRRLIAPDAGIDRVAADGLQAGTDLGHGLVTGLSHAAGWCASVGRSPRPHRPSENPTHWRAGRRSRFHRWSRPPRRPPAGCDGVARVRPDQRLVEGDNGKTRRNETR